MAKVMASGKVDPELWEWATAYAAERGVSRSRVLEGALRDLQASAMGGVPDLGAEGQPSKVRAVTPPVERSGRAGTGDDWRSLAWARQQKLNDAKYGRSS